MDPNVNTSSKDDGASPPSATVGDDPTIEVAGVSSGSKADDNFIDDEKLDDGGMKPIEVESSKKKESMFRKGRKLYDEIKSSDGGLAPYQKLFVDKRTMEKSLRVLRFAAFVDAANLMILAPNYPFMVTPGAYPDSFESTAPLNFSGAVTFIQMVGQLGMAVAAFVIGPISDKIGRKPCILFCLGASALMNVLKYFLRFNFWAFCAASFLNGLVSATSPVANAYVGDALHTQAEKQKEMALIMGLVMLGLSGGGIIAIMMTTVSLFASLWVGVALMTAAFVLASVMLIEPNRNIHAASNEIGEVEQELEDEHAPTTLNRKLLWTIIAGALVDNVGSTGIHTVCVTLLAYPKYVVDSAAIGDTAFKWVTVLLALMVIPGVIMGPLFYQKIGVATSCVVANVVSGVVTICLLYLVQLPPATSEWFWAFVAVLFVSFPFTVISQLTTSPMLDMISPPNKRGYCQGLNVAVMNFGTAAIPFFLGLVADAVGAAVSVWITIAFSFLAGVVNAPLMFIKGMGLPPKKVPEESRPLEGEDKDLVERALRGSWVPAREINRINAERVTKGQHFLALHYGKYEDDKDRLAKIKREARTAFLDLHKDYEKLLGYYNQIETEEGKAELCEAINKSSSIPSKEKDEIFKEYGQWFADYLKESGYSVHLGAPVFKQMVMSAFPAQRKGDEELTTENFELTYLRAQRLMNQFVSLLEEEKDEFSYTKLLHARTAGAEQALRKSE